MARNEVSGWHWNDERFKLDFALDGELLIIFNVADLAPAELIIRDRELADIQLARQTGGLR
jgi:hypothetical protein